MYEINKDNNNNEKLFIKTIISNFKKVKKTTLTRKGIKTPIRSY